MKYIFWSRFNLDRPDLIPELRIKATQLEWVAARLKIFKQFCKPALERQTIQDFEHWLLCNPNGPVIPPFSDSRFKIHPLSPCPPVYDVLFIRIDSDDLYAPEALEEFSKCPIDGTIQATTGYGYDTITDRLFHWAHTSPPFYATHFPILTHEMIVKEAYTSHATIKERAMAFVQKPIFMAIGHDTNIRSRYAAIKAVDIKENKNLILEKFGLKIPVKQEAREFYDNMYQERLHYKKHYSECTDYMLVWNKIIEILEVLPAPVILEVGCGSGQLAHYLWDMGYTSYTGFDYSPEAIEIARSFSSQSFKVGNALEDQPYSYTHNTVLCTEVLEHIQDDIAVIKKIKPGTTVIFSVPTFMCAGHVRCFKTEQDIRQRYGGMIRLERIHGIEVRNMGIRWYLCKGRRTNG